MTYRESRHKATRATKYKVGDLVRIFGAAAPLPKGTKGVVVEVQRSHPHTISSTGVLLSVRLNSGNLEMNYDGYWWVKL